MVGNTNASRRGRGRRAVRLVALVAGLMGLSVWTGCDGNGSPDASKQDAAVVTKRAEQGPVSLTLTSDTAKVDLATPLHVRVEVTADRTVTFEDPRYDRAIASGERSFLLRVRRGQRRGPKPADDARLRWTFDYEIAFVLPGEYELPPVELTYVESTGQGDDGGGEQTIATEPITVVAVAPPNGVPTETELLTVQRPDPVELPRAWTNPWLLAGATALAFALVYFILRHRRRRRIAEAAIPLPADVWAARQLALLVADDLIERGLVQEFFYRISGIVRGYIERRFALSAPDMTTEEFLATASADPRFPVEATDGLGAFLCACDLVKYARHEPGHDESDGALRAARGFIETTRERVGPAADADRMARSQGGRAA